MWSGGDELTRDRVYRYVAPVDGDYEIRVVEADPQAFIAALHVRRTDCHGVEVPDSCALDGTTDARDGQLARIIHLGKDEPVAIVVDGRKGRGGAFSLSVRRSRPDLALELTSVPAGAFAGERIEVAAQITNRGNGDAGPFQVTFAVAHDPALADLAGADVAGCDVAEGLAVGKTTTCPVRGFPVPLIASGSYWLGARVSTAGDSDPSNDVDAKPFSISARGVELEQLFFRAADGSSYQVLRAVPSLAKTPSELFRITTLAGSIAGAGACQLVSGAANQPISAIAGLIEPLMTLHPYRQIRRTALVHPNDVSAVSFDGGFGGILTLGRDSGAVRVCSHDENGCARRVPLVDLDANDNSLPAACIATGRAAPCDNFTPRTVLAFGPSASGDPPVCNDANQITINTTICAPEPNDGFQLKPGEVIVFVYNSTLQYDGFNVAAAGFGIDRDGSNSAGCPSNSVIAARQFAQGDSAPPPPTNTPTRTPTMTPTATPTNTPTNTPAARSAAAFPCTGRLERVPRHDRATAA
jgi:hypothetical protein